MDENIKSNNIIINVIADTMNTKNKIKNISLLLLQFIKKLTTNTRKKKIKINIKL